MQKLKKGKRQWEVEKLKVEKTEKQRDLEILNET